MNPRTVNLLFNITLYTGLMLMVVSLLFLYWEGIFKKKLILKEELAGGFLLASGLFLAVFAGISTGKEGELTMNIISYFILPIGVSLISGMILYKSGFEAGKKNSE